MSHDTPLVIAHRATMGHAPENTLLGVQRALDLGCDGVEVDTRLCADGAPILIHDDLLDRTTNASGPVAKLTLRDLEQVDAGQGQRPPTLRQALELVSGQMLFVIELKVSPGDDVSALSNAVLSEVDRAEAWPWVWLWSFDSDTVIDLARLTNQMERTERRIAHLCLSPTPDVWAIVSEHQLDGISMNGMSLTSEHVEACRAHDLAAFVWTVNEPTDIERCVNLGVTGIVGDYPERIQTVLSRA